MLAYLGDLMEDATDFIWANAKAAHAVLLCEMERGVLTWADTSRIERIRRAHAQKHSVTKQNWGKTRKIKDLGFVSNFKVGHVIFSGIMKFQVAYTGTYVLIAYHRVGS